MYYYRGLCAEADKRLQAKLGATAPGTIRHRLVLQRRTSRRMTRAMGLSSFGRNSSLLRIKKSLFSRIRLAPYILFTDNRSSLFPAAGSNTHHAFHQRHAPPPARMIKSSVYGRRQCRGPPVNFATEYNIARPAAEAARRASGEKSNRAEL